MPHFINLSLSSNGCTKYKYVRYITTPDCSSWEAKNLNYIAFSPLPSTLTSRAQCIDLTFIAIQFTCTCIGQQTAILPPPPPTHMQSVNKLY